jgi:hypothetical protein
MHPEQKLTLKESWKETSVETGNTTVGIECAESSGEGGSVTVLVVDLYMFFNVDREKERK